LCLKRPTLSCANICRGLASTRQTRRHLPTCFAWTRQTRRHLPKAIFEKNVTRLDTFARVMSESRKFGASGHCLKETLVERNLLQNIKIFRSLLNFFYCYSNFFFQAIFLLIEQLFIAQSHWCLVVSTNYFFEQC
jgi:hypothetical protein